MNKLEKRVKSERAAFLTYAAGIGVVALGAIVIYALSVLGKISFSTAVWAMVILGVVGMVLVTEGVLARSSRIPPCKGKEQAQRQQSGFVNVRLPRFKLNPRDIREQGLFEERK
jgi:archaellum biogenesis protein FlaJ (TadC family)